jgi:hypothetical protein
MPPLAAAKTAAAAAAVRIGAMSASLAVLGRPFRSADMGVLVGQITKGRLEVPEWLSADAQGFVRGLLAPVERRLGSARDGAEPVCDGASDPSHPVPTRPTPSHLVPPRPIPSHPHRISIPSQVRAAPFLRHVDFDALLLKEVRQLQDGHSPQHGAHASCNQPHPQRPRVSDAQQCVSTLYEWRCASNAVHRSRRRIYRPTASQRARAEARVARPPSSLATRAG